MDVVTSVEDIESNLSIFENYLCDGSAEDEQFAFDLIRRGSCFVAYQIDGELRFSPSRYIGYLNNTRVKHLANEDKDGKETNAAINRVVGYTLSSDDVLEASYLAFANSLGIEPYSKSRKFWRLNIDGVDFINNANSDEGFPEGKLVERKHKARERNPALITKAKNAFLTDNNRLFCVVCGFDFEEKYGKRGSGFIEAHHTIPVSDMEPGQITRVEDIALVCSNCHRMLHRERPWLSIGKLKELLNK